MDRGPVLACIYHKQIPYATVLSFPVQVKDNAVQNTSVRKSDAQNNATKIQEKVFLLLLELQSELCET
jgi:hypothetical protein